MSVKKLEFLQIFRSLNRTLTIKESQNDSVQLHSNWEGNRKSFDRQPSHLIESELKKLKMKYWKLVQFSQFFQKIQRSQKNYATQTNVFFEYFWKIRIYFWNLAVPFSNWTPREQQLFRDFKSFRKILLWCIDWCREHSLSTPFRSQTTSRKDHIFLVSYNLHSPQQRLVILLTAACNDRSNKRSYERWKSFNATAPPQKCSWWY